jgi:hypothetical protein
LYLVAIKGTLDKKINKTLFGYALEEIASGETDTIKVLLK